MACSSVRRAVAALAFAASVAVASAARAEGLTAVETARLSHGETVIRAHTLTAGDRRYVGGVTYTVVDATAAEITALFDDVDAYRKVLPRTRRARFVGEDEGDRLVELAQGNALVTAEYTIRVRRRGHEVRFWLEPSRPHDIDDAWGFFRLEPFVTERGDSKVLLTYGILVDVGPGLVRELFEEHVRAAMLSVPQAMRRHVAHLRRS